MMCAMLKKSAVKTTGSRPLKSAVATSLLVVPKNGGVGGFVEARGELPTCCLVRNVVIVVNKHSQSLGSCAMFSRKASIYSLGGLGFLSASLLALTLVDLGDFLEFYTV